jgi:hypothetical protein
MTADDTVTEWVSVACVVADAIRASEFVQAYAGRSDLYGEFGEPEVYTEWGIRDRDIPVLREWRYPGVDGAPDPKPCRHVVPAREESTDD